MPSRPEEERSSHAHRRSDAYTCAVDGLARGVRMLRMSKGWTLEHAAEQMSLDLKHLQKIEAGTVNVTLVTLTRIASGLGVEVGELFERTNERGDANTMPTPRSEPNATTNPVTAPSARERLRSVGHRIGERRRAQGWTQAELARRVGVDAGRIQRVENGRVASFPVKLLIELADVLEVDADELIKAGNVAAPRQGRPPKRLR